MPRERLPAAPAETGRAPRFAPPALPAILQLQQSAGNRAVAAMIARTRAEAPATAAPAAVTAPAPDPGIVTFCEDLWHDEPGSVLRLVLEPSRLVPGVGLLGGGIADLIAAGQ